MLVWPSFRKHRCDWIALMAVAAGLLPGCGGTDDGPKRFHVSGAILFDGKGVPAGRIQFLPDTTKGNQGPAGYAVIQNGTYNTAHGGKGTIGGPHRIIVSGLKQATAGAVESDDQLVDLSLFPTYSTDIDLPRQSTTHDIEVPRHAP